jgi:hypothetical protein
MGIAIEFNPDLALRDFGLFLSGKREKEECLPEKLEKGKTYYFLKKGQRNFWLEGELPLRKTDGHANLSRPLASIIILEATHTLFNKILYTKGKYKVIEVFDPNSPKIYFDGYELATKSQK